MSQKGDQRPSAKNILVDEFLSPEQMKKMHENQVRMKGRVTSTPSSSLQKPSSREFVIETDSREIPRVSILTQREEPDKAIQAAVRLERCLRLKLTKIKFHALTKLVGGGQHRNQKKFACRILTIVAEWKRKQHLLRSFRHVYSFIKARAKLPRAVPTLLRLVNRLRTKRMTEAFRLLPLFRLNDRSNSQLGQHSYQTSQQASQASLQLNLDPSKMKSASSSSRFARKPSRHENLTDRPSNTANQEQIIRDYEQLMTMSLSNEAREALIKMQRFDRFIYAQQSEKNLKEPMQIELRRLEKIKNGDKTLRNIYFDTEISITVLFNHIKTIFQLNRQLKEMEMLKEQNKALEGRIIEINVQKAKDIKEITATLKKPADQNARLKALEGELKEHKKLNETLYQTIRDGANDKTRKLLEVQLRKHQNQTGKELSLDRREMLEIMQFLINTVKEKPETKVEFQGPVNLAELRGDLKGLLEAQAALEKNITYLEKQKKLYETKEGESKTAENRQFYSTLSMGAGYVGSLYSEIKIKNAEISELGRKLQEIDRERQRSDRLKSDSEEKGLLSVNKLRSELQNERSKSKDLQKKLGELNRSLKTDKEKELKQKEFKEKEDNDASLREWQTLLANILAKIEKQEKTWYTDVQRHRKLLNTKRTTDRYTSLVSQNIGLLETIIKRERSLEQLSAEMTQLKQVNPTSETKRQELEERLTKEREKVKEITDERNNLRKQLQDLARVEKPEKKDLLGNELTELQKAIASIEQVFAKQAEAETQYPLDWARIKKMIDRRKFNSTLPLVGFIETLLRMLSEWEESQRRRQLELNKSEAVKQREMNSMAALNKTIDRVLDEKSLKFENVTFNRLRKILENNINKYEKMAENGEVAWCGMLKEAALSKQKILKFFEDDHHTLAAEVEQLQGYVGQLQTQLKGDKQQFERYQSEAAPKIVQLEASLKHIQEQYDRVHKQESQMILKLEQERSHLITKLQRRDQDVKRLEDKIKTLQTRQVEHLKQIKEFKQAIDMYSKEERAMLNAIELAENQNRSLMTQIAILSSGTGEQDKERAKVQHDRSELARVHQKLSHLQKELEIKEQLMQQSEQDKQRTVEEFQRQLKNVQGNLNRLLQVNSNLELEKHELEKAMNKNKRDSNDGDSQLASQNVKLYNEVVKMQQKVENLELSCKQIEDENIRLREQLNQKQEQQLNLINKVNKLEKEVVDFRSENDMLVLNTDQYEHQVKELRDRLLETERNNRETFEEIRLKEETYKSTIFQLRSEIQRYPSPLLLEELKNDFKRKQEGYLKMIEEIRLNFEKDASVQHSSHKLQSELERANMEVGRMRAELKSQEQYIRQLSDQHEGAIQRRTQSYESQLELMRRELDQLSVTHPEAIRRVDAEHRQRQSELHRVHEDALNKFYNKERQMQNEISNLRAELMRLNKTATAPSNLEIELKRQEEHYERVLIESTATSNSQIRLLEGESTRLKHEIGRLQKEAREREQYYTRLIESNEQLYASREKVSDTSTANIKLEISRNARDSNLERQLQIQLKRQEQHYLKLIEQNASIFESKQKSYETEILNLHQEITKLTRETVQHSIVQNLETELHRQQDHYLKLIEQNNIIFESKEKSYETEITQLRNELSKYQLNFRTLQDNHQRVSQQSQALAASKEKLLEGQIGRLRVELMKMETDVKIPAEGVQQQLRKQKEYYTSIIDQNTRSYDQQRNELEGEVARLKIELQRQSREMSSITVVTSLQQELKRQEQHYLLLLSQNNTILESKERSFQAEINQMRMELKKTETALQTQEDSYKKVLAQNTVISTQKISSLEVELNSLRETLRNFEANPPINQTILNEQLRKQKEYFSELLDQSAAKFAVEESKFKSEVRSLSGTNSMLTQELTRLKYESARVGQLANENSSLQAQIERLARELEVSKAQLKSETDRLIQQLQSTRATSTADSDRLTKELHNARNSNQTAANDELRKKDEYYLKIIDQNRSASQSRVKELESIAAKLREQLNISRSELLAKTRDLIHPQVLDREMKNMEAHFTKLLDDNVIIFQTEEAKLNAQINELRTQLGKVQTEGSQQTLSVRKMSGDLQQRDDQLRKLTNDVQLKDDHIKKLNGELEVLKRIASETQQKDDQINRLSTDFQLKEQQLKQIVLQLSQKDDQLRVSSSELQIKVEQIKKLQVDVRQKEEQVKRLTLDIQQKEEATRTATVEFQGFKRTVGDTSVKDDQIKRLTLQVQQSTEHIGQLTIQIQQKDEHFRGLIIELEQRDEHIRGLIFEHKQKDEHLTALVSQLQLKDQQIRNIGIELESFQKVANNQQTKQEQIRRLTVETQQKEQQARKVSLELQQKEEQLIRINNQAKSKDEVIRKLTEQQSRQLQINIVKEKSMQEQISALVIKEKAYQSDISIITQRQRVLLEETNKLKILLDEAHQTMLPIVHLEEELHKQEQHFTQLLDMNANTYMEQEKKFEVEIQNLKKGIAEGAGKQALENELKLVKERHTANERTWQAETQQLKSKLSSIEAELNLSRSQKVELDQLRISITNISTQLSQAKVAASECQQLKLVISNLQSDISILRIIETEAKELRSVLIKLQAEKGRLEAENNGLRNVSGEAQQLRITISNLQADVRNIQGEKQQLLNSIGHLEAELKGLSIVQAEAQQLRLSVSSLTNELAVLRNSQAQSLQLRSKLSATENELNQSRSLLTENQQLRSTVAGLQAELNAIKSLQNEYTQLRAAVSTLEIENSSLKGVQVQAQQLRVTLANVQTELNNLRSAQLEAQQFRLKFGSLEYELAQSKNIEADNQQLRNTLLALQNDLNSLRNVQMEAQEFKMRVGGLETDILQVRKENHELKIAIQNLNGELRGTSDNESTTKFQMKQLQAELDRIRLQLERANKEANQLKQNPPPQLIETELRKQELHFVRLLEDNASIFKGKEREFEAESIRLRTELRKQEENCMKLLDDNAHKYQTKEKQFELQISQLRQELDRIRQSSVSASLSNKEIESLRSQLVNQEQLYKSQLQTQDQLFKSQLQSMEQQSKAQLLILEQQNKRFLNDNAGSSSQFELQTNRLRSQLALVQKDRDSRIQENLERMKFYEQHSDKLTKTISQLETRLTEAKADIFKLREVSHTLELNKARLEDQLKISTTSNKSVEEVKYNILAEERHRLQIDVDRLRLKSEQEQQIRRDLEEKYSSVMREKSSLLERIDKLQSIIYEKEMELVRSLQKREQNIQELLTENKALQLELKKIQEKLIAYEFKSVLSPSNQVAELPRVQNNEAELQLLRDENSFVKERIRFLEAQLRDARHDDVRTDPTGDKYLLKMEGERLKQNLQEVEQNNMDLYNRINALTRGDGERDDYLEIGILKKINEEVTELIESNKMLADQVRYLQIENRTLNQTIASVGRGGNHTNGINAPLASGEEMAAQITRVLDSVADLLNEQSMSEELCDKYDHYMERLEGCLQKRNLNRYLQIFQEFIRTIFISLIDSKDHMLQKQAATLLELRQKMGDLIDQQIEQSEYSERMSPPPVHGHSMYEDRNNLSQRRHDQHSLQYLWKHYVKYRRPDTLEEMGRLLHVDEQ